MTVPLQFWITELSRKAKFYKKNPNIQKGIWSKQGHSGCLYMVPHPSQQWHSESRGTNPLGFCSTNTSPFRGWTLCFTASNKNEKISTSALLDSYKDTKYCSASVVFVKVAKNSHTTPTMMSSWCLQLSKLSASLGSNIGTTPCSGRRAELSPAFPGVAHTRFLPLFMAQDINGEAAFSSWSWWEIIHRIWAPGYFAIAHQRKLWSPPVCSCGTWPSVIPVPQALQFKQQPQAVSSKALYICESCPCLWYHSTSALPGKRMKSQWNP